MIKYFPPHSVTEVILSFFAHFLFKLTTFFRETWKVLSRTLRTKRDLLFFSSPLFFLTFFLWSVFFSWLRTKHFACTSIIQKVEVWFLLNRYMKTGVNLINKYFIFRFGLLFHWTALTKFFYTPVVFFLLLLRRFCNTFFLGYRRISHLMRRDFD